MDGKIQAVRKISSLCRVAQESASNAAKLRLAEECIQPAEGAPRLLHVGIPGGTCCTKQSATGPASAVTIHVWSCRSQQQREKQTPLSITCQAKNICIADGRGRFPSPHCLSQDNCVLEAFLHPQVLAKAAVMVLQRKANNAILLKQHLLYSYKDKILHFLKVQMKSK
ncbi:uncharacterized protein LJ206_007060 isoform 1-T1 [Theristicus caerulescens]